MPVAIEEDIEQFVEDKPAPVVRFSPLLTDAAPAAHRGRRLVLGVSIPLHLLVFAIFMLLPKRPAAIDEPMLPVEIVFVAPGPAIPEMTLPPPPKAAPKPMPKPKPRELPRVEAPAPPVAEAPKPPPPPVPAAPEPAPVVKVQPPRPRPEVKTGLLDEAPSGPAIAVSHNSHSAVIAGGFDGEAGAPSSSPRPGRITQVAFDDPRGASRKPRAEAAVVSEAGFGAEAAAPRKRAAESSASSAETDVEILTKPKPVYTDEARALKLEGDVVLDVVFEASGILRVIGLVQGLGHGLDEAAIVAAKKIQFTPARRDGNAVDHAAKLRVVFRLA